MMTAALKEAQDAYMRRLFVESLGFAGCKMTRRILGLAHVEDLESIADADLRAECEKRALKLARAFMVRDKANQLVGDQVKSGLGKFIWNDRSKICIFVL